MVHNTAYTHKKNTQTHKIEMKGISKAASTFFLFPPYPLKEDVELQ